MTWRRTLTALLGATAAATLISVAAPAFAEEVTLRMISGSSSRATAA